MSVSGISSSSLYNAQSAQSSFQQAQQLFQQLGKDLQAGNLSAAQSDFTSLQNLLPQTTATTAAQSSNPIAQAFAQLGKDLQSGNLSAAQQDFKTIQQDSQNQAAQTQTIQGHHHHHGGGGSSEISQLFAQLGSALQSGDLSSAQQAFSSLTQQFQQFAQPNAASAESPASSSSGVSVSA
jgi:hypothetical protein